MAEDRLEPLIQAYAGAWAGIKLREDEIARTASGAKRRRLIRDLERYTLVTLDRLDAFTKDFIKAEFPGVYTAGGQRAAQRAGIEYTFTQADQRAINKLSGDLFGDLLEKTQFVRSDTKRAIRRMTRDELISGRTSGRGPQATRRALTERLEAKGIQGVRYKNGRYVRLDDYADMAIRTKSAVASNTAGVEFGRGQGIQYWECIDGPDCGLTSHKDSTLATGLVLPAEEALAYPISHPRCRRDWIPRPDISTIQDAKDAGATVTDEQIADQAAFDEQRRADLARRNTALRRREARLARRERRLAS